MVCCKCMEADWLVFIQWTVSLDWHVTNKLNFIFVDLINAERQYRYFQQDNSRTHDATICEAHETRMGNKWFCISRLNDFLLLQFYLFGNLKGKVYQNNIPTSLALQNEIIHVIVLVTGWFGTCHRTFVIMFTSSVEVARCKTDSFL